MVAIPGGPHKHCEMTYLGAPRLIPIQHSLLDVIGTKFIYIYIYMHIYICIMYICTYTYMYISEHIHTYVYV